MNGSDGREWSGVDCVEDGVDTFQEIAHTGKLLGLRQRSRSFVEFAEVGACRESTFPRPGDDARSGIRAQRWKRRNKLFQLGEHDGADLSCGFATERQL